LADTSLLAPPPPPVRTATSQRLFADQLPGIAAGFPGNPRVEALATSDTSKADSEKTNKTEKKCKYCNAPACCRICRSVPEKQKVSETVFSVECEDFCVPGRSSVQCQESVDENGCVTTEREWIPNAERMRQRMKLVKSTETKEETKWKLVVEHVCQQCAQCPPSTEKDASKEQSKESKTTSYPESPNQTGRFMGMPRNNQQNNELQEGAVLHSARLPNWLKR
jgi:hypothetical protein